MMTIVAIQLHRRDTREYQRPAKRFKQSAASDEGTDNPAIQPGLVRKQDKYLRPAFPHIGQDVYRRVRHQARICNDKTSGPFRLF